MASWMRQVDGEGEHAAGKPGARHLEDDGLPGDDFGHRLLPVAAHARLRLSQPYDSGSQRCPAVVSCRGRRRLRGRARARVAAAGRAGQAAAPADRRRGRRARACSTSGPPPTCPRCARRRTTRSWWRSCPAGSPGPGPRSPARTRPSGGSSWRFALVSFPLMAYRARWWWLATGVTAGLVVAFSSAGGSPARRRCRRPCCPSRRVRKLVNHQFQGYYSQYAAPSFAAKVWTNNAVVAAGVADLRSCWGCPRPLVPVPRTPANHRRGRRR